MQRLKLRGSGLDIRARKRAEQAALRTQRKAGVAKALQQDDSLTNFQLSEMFGVPITTIKNDIKEFRGRGLDIIRTRRE